MGEVWAGGGVIDDTASDLAVFGAPAEIIEEAEQNSKDEVFEVWPENLEVVALFLRLSTQWNHSFSGDLVGLNYQSVEFLFKLYKVKDRKGTLEDLQIIEASAIQTLRKLSEERRSSGSKLPSGG